MIGKHDQFRLVIYLSVFSIGFVGNAKAETDSLATEVQKCRAVSKDDERLKCFDSLARRHAPATYRGKLGKVTETFTLTEPHILRYRSYGVIFVLYLRDGDGNVLQNLHVGGRGEDEYVIEQPGDYSLKIDGSADWEIWLQPADGL